MSEFAKLLSEFRKRAKISQYALAKKIDMNPAHLNRIENGLRNPPKRDKVLLISEVLGLNEEEKAELLIKARYAPQSINIGAKSYDISKRAVYESPAGAEEIAKIVPEVDLSNPTLRLVSETLTDQGIPLESKVEMEREITCFVSWLRDKMLSNKFAVGLEKESSRLLRDVDDVYTHGHSRRVLQITMMIAHKFIKSSFPEEVPLFESAWQLFKNVPREEFRQKIDSRTIEIAGREASKLATPKVIVLSNEISRKGLFVAPKGKTEEEVNKICRIIGCSRDLTRKFTDFIMQQQAELRHESENIALLYGDLAALRNAPTDVHTSDILLQKYVSAYSAVSGLADELGSITKLMKQESELKAERTEKGMKKRLALLNQIEEATKRLQPLVNAVQSMVGFL